ncbi:MAG TPA: TfoX/Sxy family protein [Polyangiaceae bacterium]|nr:TfoX/Sxy family protein [Polyangiaceae bacterium]
MASQRNQPQFVVTQRDPVREWVQEALGTLPELSIRRMFGGSGIYSEETFFGILYARRVYLKTNESTRAAFVERGSEALRVRSGSVLTSYYEVPAEVLDDEEELLRWARLALDVAHEQPERPRRRAHVSPEQILEDHGDAIRQLAEQARALVKGVAPEATEAGYSGWQLIGYRAPHYFCFVAPQPDHVRLGFEHGHALPDPAGVLEPMGKQVRFVRLEPGKRVPIRALRALIQAALEQRPVRVEKALEERRGKKVRASGKKARKRS